MAVLRASSELDDLYYARLAKTSPACNNSKMGFKNMLYDAREKKELQVGGAVSVSRPQGTRAAWLAAANPLPLEMFIFTHASCAHCSNLIGVCLTNARRGTWNSDQLQASGRHVHA